MLIDKHNAFHKQLDDLVKQGKITASQKHEMFKAANKAFFADARAYYIDRK